MNDPVAPTPWYEQPAYVAARTCWWTSVSTGVLMVVTVLVLAVVLRDGEYFSYVAPFLLLAWAVVVVLTWLLGWPAGWLAEHVLDRVQASDVVRVTVLAVLGAVMSAAITAGSVLTVPGDPVAASLSALVGAAVGAVGAGTGRWVVVHRNARFSPAAGRRVTSAVR